MHRKRQQKEFPPGTFIPTPARILAILQLSLGIFFLLWHLSAPFTGELFSIRSRTVVYEYVIGVPDGSKIREKNAERFKNLSEEKQKLLIDNYSVWQKKLHQSFWKKLKSSLENILFNMPFFEKIWIIFSIALPILILLKVEGAVHAAWLLPIIVFAYSVDNKQNGITSELSPDQQLFPTEAYLNQHYGNGQTSSNLFAQQEELKKSWELYLVNEWAEASHSSGSDLRANLIEEGEYRFTTARALAITDLQQKGHTKEANGVLAVYLIWNIAFAYVVSKWKNCDTLCSPARANGQAAALF